VERTGKSGKYSQIEGSVMSKWKEVISGDVIDLISGYAFKSKDFKEFPNEGDLPVIKIKNVANGDVNFEKVVYHQVTDSLQKYILKKGEVLIAMTGNHPQSQNQVVGDVSRYKFNENALVNQRVGKIISKNDNSLDFFYYYFKDKGTKDYLANQSSGSANQANISKGDILGVPMLIPEPEEQRAIASVLSSLDDKIDLLHRQNQILEQMAETLFRQWFVEETDEGWEEGVLGDLVEVKYGKDHKKLIAGDIPVYGSGGIMRYAERPICKEESVLIPRKGSLNNIIYLNEPFWTVDTMFYTVMKRPNLVKFIYHFLKEKDLASMNVGSAVPSMTTAVLNSMPINLPSDEFLEKFENNVSSFYQKIKSNNNQIRTLTALRDILLPKLMSGEVQLNNISNG
jgi:type I restriction enzyme S subunit